VLGHHIDGAELVTKREGKARLRRAIFRDWGTDCAYCGIAADTLDHVLALARGGVTARENLVPACSGCNLSKGHRDVLEWFRAHHGWSSEREQRLADWIQTPGSSTSDGPRLG
jgi:5-methylcytosine-specific restriction endonuclease McrA